MRERGECSKELGGLLVVEGGGQLVESLERLDLETAGVLLNGEGGGEGVVKGGGLVGKMCQGLWDFENLGTFVEYWRKYGTKVSPPPL